MHMMNDDDDKNKDECEHFHYHKMDCCQHHDMSKEHLMIKKEMLEKKLKWVNDELSKQEGKNE